MDRRADAELVGLARTGDKEAFGRLVVRYQPMAKSLAMGMVGNEHIAQELVQEAMLQAYLSLHHLRDNNRFKSWLYGIVLNVCRSYIRDQKVSVVSLEALTGGLRFETVPFTGTAPDPQEVAEEQELHRRVLAAVNALSPKNRASTLLFYYEQLSLQEVANILGVSVLTVKGRLHRARKELLEKLLEGYPERKRRRKVMVRVTVADVIQQKTEGSTPYPFATYVVILLDEAGNRALPIWIGPAEGTAIAAGLREVAVPRPLTFTFMAHLLRTVGVEVVEVRVEKLKRDTFYGVVKLRSGEGVKELDARPSDAIALAVHAGSPIYVAEEILKRAGTDVSAHAEKASQLGKGLEGIMTELEQKIGDFQSRPRHTDEQIESIARELMDFVFSAEA